MLALDTAEEISLSPPPPPSPPPQGKQEETPGCSGKEPVQEQQCLLNNNLQTTPLTPLESKCNSLDYVELPNSSIPRWNLIKEQVDELKRVVREGGNVGEAIKKCVLGYNSGSVCTFGVLYNMIEVALGLFGDVEVREVVEFIGDAALGVEEIGGVKKLKGVEGGGDVSVELRRKEVLSLLACAFLCTFPERDDNDAGGSYARYSRINFDGLFDDKDQSSGLSPSWRMDMKEAKVHRLLCIFNYFRRMRERIKAGKTIDSKLIYERRTLSPEHTPKWGVHLKEQFCMLKILESGSIDDSKTSLRIDFANKLVGGGTLGNGAAMEEIMFSLSSELIACLVFTEVLRDNECVVVRGAEKFSNGVGYGAEFRWQGDYLDESVEENRVGIMDAVKFEKNSLRTQLRKKWIVRELTKVFVTVKGADVVASGKWGAGVFNGDPLLKCLIQWISASVAGVRVLELYTFGDKVLSGQLRRITEMVQGCSVGKMIRVLVNFRENYSDNVTTNLLFDNICAELGDNDGEKTGTLEWKLELTDESSDQSSENIIQQPENISHHEAAVFEPVSNVDEEPPPPPETFGDEQSDVEEEKQLAEPQAGYSGSQLSGSSTMSRQSHRRSSSTTFTEPSAKKKKATAPQEVTRYVGKDVFGNYQMLPKKDLLKLLNDEKPGHGLDKQQQKLLANKVNNFLEDFFTQECEDTDQPLGFVPFLNLKKVMVDQCLLEEDATGDDLLEEMKKNFSKEDWKRSERVLYPSRYSRTGNNDNYLYE